MLHSIQAPDVAKSGLSQEVSALMADAIAESILPDELTDDMVKAFDVIRNHSAMPSHLSVSAM